MSQTSGYRGTCAIWPLICIETFLKQTFLVDQWRGWEGEAVDIALRMPNGSQVKGRWSQRLPGKSPWNPHVSWKNDGIHEEDRLVYVRWCYITKSSWCKLPLAAPIFRTARPFPAGCTHSLPRGQSARVGLGSRGALVQVMGNRCSGDQGVRP